MLKFQPITKEYVLKRLAVLTRKENNRRLKLAKEYRETAARGAYDDGTPIDDAEWFINRAAEYEVPTRYNFPVKYFSRLHEFKGSNFGFDPMTGDGHSYRWYALTKVIKGNLVLNAYGYSNQTCNHRNELSSLFRKLGIKYLELEAPRGLQNLDSAMVYCTMEEAREIVRTKYARDKKGSASRIKYWEDQRLYLKSLGIKGSSKAALAGAVQAAESERRSKLDRLKKRRLDKLARAKIQIVLIQPGDTSQDNAIGLHEFDQYFRFGGYREDSMREEAVRKGFSTVFVHLHEKEEEIEYTPRRASLSLVQGGAQ